MMSSGTLTAGSNFHMHSTIDHIRPVGRRLPNRTTLIRRWDFTLQMLVGNGKCIPEICRKIGNFYRGTSLGVISKCFMFLPSAIHISIVFTSNWMAFFVIVIYHIEYSFNCRPDATTWWSLHRGNRGASKYPFGRFLCKRSSNQTWLTHCQIKSTKQNDPITFIRTLSFCPARFASSQTK